MRNKIPITVMVVTKNAQRHLKRCLKSVQDFDEVIVVDSKSADDTVRIAQEHNVSVIDFEWNGAYPKKRQWCLDTINTRHEWIFFVDADEEVTEALKKELLGFDQRVAGAFVKGRPVMNGKALRHGLWNNKIALLNKNKMAFPVVDDLDIDGMGEIEGHYQPVLKDAFAGEEIAQLQSPLLHHCYEDLEAHRRRHEGYAQWEARMIKRAAYPRDPLMWRAFLKSSFRRSPVRGWISFLYIYVVRLGFLDGVAGFRVANTKRQYYQDVRRAQNFL